MRPSFNPRLVNGPFEDPGLFIPLTYHKRALLFDLGDLSPLSPGDMLKITHVFITHTHMDHFIGFDQLLRLLLGRGKEIRLWGPRGFLKNIRGKLQGYTWNLVHNYTEGLNIKATEIRSQSCITQTFRCQDGFSPSPAESESLCAPYAYEEPGFIIQTAILDHQIPSLALAMEERFHINMIKPRMEAMGLAVGPWIAQFKKLLFEDADASTEIEVQFTDSRSGQNKFSIGELTDKITRITPGQKIAYIADALYSAENVEKIITIAHKADHLFIEAAFLEEDRETAKDKCHLTAHQAGTIARKADVREMSIFHHSPRYMDKGQLLRNEAMNAFMS